MLYSFLVGITFLKSINPYFRKHVLSHLDSHDFFLLINLVIIGILFIILMYRYFFDKSFDSSIKKIKSLKISHICCIFIIALLTIISGIAIMEMDKNYNTPMVNAIFTKTFSTIALVLVGIFVFKEKYTFLQIIGVFMTIIGIFLISNKNLLLK